MNIANKLLYSKCLELFAFIKCYSKQSIKNSKKNTVNRYCKGQLFYDILTVFFSVHQRQSLVCYWRLSACRYVR